MKDSGVALKTVNDYTGYIIEIFRWDVENGYAREDVHAVLTRVKKLNKNQS